MIMRELQQAWRRLARRPGYAALSIAVLGVGLGVVLFLFSLINTLILQPLPFPHADRLVAVGEARARGIGINRIDSDQYLLLKGKLHSVDAMGAYADVGLRLNSGAGAIRYRGYRLTASMMELLGVKPLLGRGFVAADDRPGAARVLLLSETLWRQVFKADPGIIGRDVRVNGDWTTVIGVLPASFRFPVNTEAWLPLRLEPGMHRGISAVARLAPAIQLSQARAELDTWSDQLQHALPPTDEANRQIIKPLSLSFTPEDMRQWVWLMFGAGVLVLLLACINVANLQLVQTLGRQRELALRSALGGSRARLMLGALAESLLLSVSALALAFPIAYAGQRWMVATWVAVRPGTIPFMHGIDAWVVAFGAAAAVLVTLLAGGIPAWRASRANLQDALRDGSKGSGGGFARVAKILVVVEVALTVVLLVGAGTFVRAMNQLLAQPAVGATHASQVLTAHVALPPEAYSEDAQRIRFFDTVVERLRRDPAVLAATASNAVPSATLGSHETVALPGHPKPTDGWPWVQMGIVDSHFLDTYDVHLLKGRFFAARDRAENAPVVVIDRKMAQAMWPQGGALNRKLILYPGEPWTRPVTVIGVIEPLQLDNMLEESLPGLLMPLDQAAGQSPLQSVGLAVRTHADAVAYTQRLTEVVHSVDPQAAVYAVYTQARVMEMRRIGLTVLTKVFSALGLVALLLAAAGLYGVLAFSVAQRTREIGIRRAIGAGNSALVREVMRQMVWQLGLGVMIGTALAMPWSSVLADPGLHTRAHDPAVFVPVLLLVVGVSVLAALLPTLRALRVDPAVALHYE